VIAEQTAPKPIRFAPTKRTAITQILAVAPYCEGHNYPTEND